MGTAYVFGEKCSGVRNMTGDIMQKRKMNTYIQMCRACGFFTGACLLATALSAMACKQTNKSGEETCRVAKVIVRTPCDLSIESQIKLLRQWRAGCEVSRRQCRPMVCRNALRRVRLTAWWPSVCRGYRIRLTAPFHCRVCATCVCCIITAMASRKLVKWFVISLWQMI